VSRLGGWGPIRGADRNDSTDGADRARTGRPGRRRRVHDRRRGPVAAGVCGLVAVLTVLLLPARADAHAELLSTEPESSEQLATAPDEVVLHFSEAVDLSADTLEVLDATGRRLDIGDPGHPGGERTTVSASLPDLDDGAYVVAWRVVSSDSHPIGGAFTFRVGEAGAVSVDDQALIDDVLGGSRDGDAALGAAYGVVRFVAFAGLTVLVGSVLFLAWLWPAGAADRRARRIVGASWVTATVATVLCIPFQGAYVAGGTLGDLIDPDVIADELGTRTGRSWVVRLLLLAAAAVVLPRLSSALAGRRAGGADTGTVDPGTADAGGADAAHGGRAPVGTAVARAVAVIGGIALLVTVSLTGHAVSGDLVPLAFVADVVHLSGVSVWFGGLVVLVLAVLWPGRTDGGLDEAEVVVGRFSQVAFGAVVAIVVSGTVQGWRQVGTYDALLDTTYGRLLVVKVVLFTGMLVAAAVSRSWVRQRAVARSASLALSPGPGAVAASPDSGRSRLSVLRQSVGAEVGLAVVVLVVTALLVNAVPGETAQSSSGGGGPFTTQVTEDDIVLSLDVDPAAVGPVDLHLYINEPDGTPLQPEEVRAAFSLPERDLGPITVTLVDYGQGHYSADGAEIPLAGDWELEVVVRTSDIDQTTFDTVVPVS
jgi:copper transport protein